MQALRGHAHVERVGADQFLGEKTWVGVNIATEGMAAHVFHTAGYGEVVCAKGDAPGNCRDCGHSTGAHPIECVSGDAEGKASEDAGGSAESESLVTLLGSGSNGNIVNTVAGHPRVALQEAYHRAHNEVIGPGVPKHSLLTRATKWCAHTVNENNPGLCHCPAPLPLAPSC